MNKIYNEISQLSNEFKAMAHGLTQNKERINDAVQELMLYFLQMNQERLKEIYDKDGIVGIKKYGAVCLRRFITSKRSPFYYKYDKYYKNLASPYQHNSSVGKRQSINYNESIYNLAEDIPDVSQWEKLEYIDNELDKLNWYDKELFKLYYYESNTLDSLASKTKISRNSLFTTIDKVRNILKKKCNETLQSEN